MVLTNTENIKNVSTIVSVKCDFGLSEKCKQIYSMMYRDAIKSQNKNSGKILCRECSIKLQVGRNAPSCKFKTLRDDIFNKIDTIEKSYVLGWFGSDGQFIKRTHECRLGLEIEDIEHVKFIKDLVCPELKVKNKHYGKCHVAEFSMNSKEICEDCCRHLKIPMGKKSNIIRLPDLEDSLMWFFLSGYFGGDGTITSIYNKRYYPYCSIASDSFLLINDIKDFVNIKCCITPSSPNHKHYQLIFSGNNCLEFMNNIFKIKDYALPRKYLRFLEWSDWYPKKERPCIYEP